MTFGRLNDATLRVLAKNGCEVVIPAEQGCCGAKRFDRFALPEGELDE
jgi:Fe-S oxidoreductase